MKSLTLPWSGKLYKGRAPRWRYSRSVGGNGLPGLLSHYHCMLEPLSSIVNVR